MPENDQENNTSYCSECKTKLTKEFIKNYVETIVKRLEKLIEGLESKANHKEWQNIFKEIEKGENDPRLFCPSCGRKFESEESCPI